MHKYKIGDVVSYYSYGILITGKITRLSKAGTILFLEGSKFVFAESAIKWI